MYHYTNKEGADGIKASKRIKKSRRKIRDAYFGDGVYFTSLTPDNSTEDLSYEMFGQHDGHRSKVSWEYRVVGRLRVCLYFRVSVCLCSR